MSKSTNLIVRLPKVLKNRFEQRCERIDLIPSVAMRGLIRDFAEGTPTKRKLLLSNGEQFNAILKKLHDLEGKHE